MKCFIISSFIFFSSFAALAQQGKTTYDIRWSYSKMPLSITVYEASLALMNRISEVGEFKDRSQFPIFAVLSDGKIQASPGENRVLVLVIKNTSDKEVKFAVAPHAIQPVEASLGMNFKCLCNGHKYSIGPGKSWYRILLLKTFKAVSSAKATVVLEHQIFPVE